MRISKETARTAGKVTRRAYIFGGWTMRVALTAFIIFTGAAVHEGTLVPEGESSPIEELLLQVPDDPVEGLGEFLKEGEEQEAAVSKPQKKMKLIKLMVSKKCHQYDNLLRKYFSEPEFRLRKAQMQKESSCDHLALGSAGEKGLFQLKAGACKDVGVKGDLYNPETNIKCASKYLRHLCKA